MTTIFLKKKIGGRSVNSCVIPRPVFDLSILKQPGANEDVWGRFMTKTMEELLRIKKSLTLKMFQQ